MKWTGVNTHKIRRSIKNIYKITYLSNISPKFGQEKAFYFFNYFYTTQADSGQLLAMWIMLHVIDMMCCRVVTRAKCLGQAVKVEKDRDKNQVSYFIGPHKVNSYMQFLILLVSQFQCSGRVPDFAYYFIRRSSGILVNVPTVAVFPRLKSAWERG